MSSNASVPTTLYYFTPPANGSQPFSKADRDPVTGAQETNWTRDARQVHVDDVRGHETDISKTCRRSWPLDSGQSGETPNASPPCIEQPLPGSHAFQHCFRASGAHGALRHPLSALAALSAFDAFGRFACIRALKALGELSDQGTPTCLYHTTVMLHRV